MIELRTPRGTVALLIGSILTGFVMATLLTEPPEIDAVNETSSADWELPVLRESGEGIQRIRSILSRQPWGGRLAEVANGGVARGNRRGESNEQPEARNAERDVARWRYLGSVRHGGAVNAVFLDESEALVHLAGGEKLGGQLKLSVLEEDHVIFDSVDNGRSVRLQLFGDTALELELNVLPESETAPPAGDGNYE